MTISIILLLSAIVPGLVAIYNKRFSQFNLKFWMIFAGTYIFSITVIHLMPEIYLSTQKPKLMAIFVLFGFFVQIFIDHLSGGIEHGHGHDHIHHHHSSPLTLMIGLCIHALLDGSILVHPQSHGHDHVAPEAFHSIGLLVGVIIHKVPASIVLTAILLHYYKNVKWVLVMLAIFAFSSPIGYLGTEYLNGGKIVDDETFNIIFSIVCGNFLHISTTIFFESEPNHKFSSKKILFALAGALVAVAIELLHH